MASVSLRLRIALFTFLATAPLARAQTSETELNHALADAAEFSDLDQVRALLAKGANPNGAADSGLSAAHWAGLHITKPKAKAILKELVRAGLVINAPDKDGTSLLGKIVGAGKIEEFEILRSEFGAIFNPSEPGLLHRAIAARSYSTLRFLKLKGVSLDTPSDAGSLPVEYAARMCNPDATLVLLLGGASKGRAHEIVQANLAQKPSLSAALDPGFLIQYTQDCQLVADLLNSDLARYPKLRAITIIDDGGIGGALRFNGLLGSPYRAINEGKKIREVLDAGPAIEIPIAEILEIQEAR